MNKRQRQQTSLNQIEALLNEIDDDTFFREMESFEENIGPKLSSFDLIPKENKLHRIEIKVKDYQEKISPTFKKFVSSYNIQNKSLTYNDEYALAA